MSIATGKRHSPADNPGGQGVMSGLVPLSFAALTVVLSVGGYFGGLSEYALPAALIAGLAAYGFFTRWVYQHAPTGGPVIRFLERIRRAAAHE